ncbi:MAG TPA: hypothetical protein PLI09_01860 [Candidatus Hydrogenedentes bacterium]|nr:hypothetical protein [Candidatus Hydrogenedentota bacterium]
MAGSELESVVLDTSVLINFLAINRIDLLARHPQYRFSVTDHVRREVTIHYPEQMERLNAALASDSLMETRVEAIEELTLFAQLISTRRLGAGECAAIAAAIHRNQILALDDKAARKAALLLNPKMLLLDTQTLMVSLIRAGHLTIQQADGIKDLWAREHSFQLKIATFKDILI